jgi:hypothetical protein
MKTPAMQKLLSLGIAAALGVCLLSCDTMQQAASGWPGSSADTTAGKPTNAEISSGIKQALQIGLQDGVKQVSAVNGFYKNPLIKIPFPPAALRVEIALRKIGLGQLCDNVELSLNRAAEDAASKATPLFLNALRQMTLQDATGILMGSDTSATSYFRRATTARLTAAFSPVNDQSLKKVDATRYWSQAVTEYNKIPFVKPVNTDLTAYVTGRAIDGLFVVIGQKETQIRQQLGARTTPLLKKVFGFAERAK